MWTECGKTLNPVSERADKDEAMHGDRVALPKMWVTPEARDGWREFCLNWGVTRTAVVEALGLAMIDMNAGRLPVTRTTIAVIERAKRIDKERQRRLL